MEKFATENLILMEFLVDQLNLDYDVSRNLEGIAGDTCVSFQFLDNAPMLVCEQDFAGEHANRSGIKNGKSCLFSLSPQQAQDASKQFDVHVEVFKKMKPGILPEKLPIGESLISIINLFNELVASISDSGESPSAKTLKDCFKITNAKGNDVGHVSVYIRMSCFGKLIVTQFQMNLEDKSVQFRAKEGHYLFKYSKGKKTEESQGQGGDQIGPAAIVDQDNNKQECPMQPCIFQPQQPPCMAPPPPCGMCWSNCQTPCGVCGMTPPPYGICPSLMSPPPCRKPPSETPCVECSAPPDPAGAYQEIGASMGGNALTIRVHKDRGNIEEITDSDSSVCCSCTAEKKPPCRPPQQTLAMRPGAGDPNSPFSFKMGGCGAGASNNVTVNPPHSVAADGTCFTEISDPNKDVFVLRIGKKSEGVDKKNNLELELCTPKGPAFKPPPKKETRDTQYDETDVPAEAAPEKGKGGKGKGGKDKGGKKGKKK